MFLKKMVLKEGSLRGPTVLTRVLFLLRRECCVELSANETNSTSNV